MDEPLAPDTETLGPEPDCVTVSGCAGVPPALGTVTVRGSVIVRVCGAVPSLELGPDPEPDPVTVTVSGSGEGVAAPDSEPATVTVRGCVTEGVCRFVPSPEPDIG